MDQDTFAQILTELADGSSTVKACAKLGVRRGSLFDAIAADPELADRYARAKMAGLEAMADDILEIADDASGDVEIRTNSSGEEYEAQNQEFIARSRLRVDSRKWLLSKLAPKKYGEKLQTEHSGDITIRPVDFSQA